MAETSTNPQGPGDDTGQPLALDPTFEFDRLSVKTQIAILPPEYRAQVLASLSDAQIATLMASWRFEGRPDQFAPVTEKPWLTWLALGGRGAGKSRAVCEWAHERFENHYLEGERTGNHRLHRLGAASRSTGDARETLVEGESGLMAVAEARGIAAKYEPSKRRISWPDLNARATLFSAEEPDNARGPQYHTVIGDELAAWDFTITDDLGNNLLTNLMFGLRLGDDPRAGFATTPKRIPELREMVNDALDDDNFTTVMSRMTSMDNAANLSAVFLDTVIGKYKGTRLYRQEVEGILLDDDDDVLWSEADIARAHRYANDWGKVPEVGKIVIGVDPPGKSTGDLCGIVAVGLLTEPLPQLRSRCAVIMADRSRQGSPEQWGRAVVDLCRDLGTTKVVAERNQGQEMVRSIISNADDSGTIEVELVNAQDNKILRAEPVSHVYEQGRVVHAAVFPFLEEEMVEWVKGGSSKSPDRLDAMVHAVTSLLPEMNQRPSHMSSTATVNINRRRAAASSGIRRGPARSYSRR